MRLSVHPSHKSLMEKYGRIAVRGTCCGPQSSCSGGGRATDVALDVGDADAEPATLPEGGNPTALAELKPGETVLDLGSEAGLKP